MGEVYRAEDLLLSQPVALKFLAQDVASDRDRMERLLGEVRLSRQVSHPNVCRVYDVAEADGHRFFSMELVEGEDLASLLRQVGRVPRERAIELARQLCAGVAAAHERGVVHRDLKPSNIMVDADGRVRITDFGLALAEATTGPEAFGGTPAYMAPEQLAGKAATERSDLWSLGVVLYELFTGRRPFQGRSVEALRREMEESRPSPPSAHVEGLDPAVERVILRCLETHPGDRPPSVAALAAALPGGDPLAAALAAGETPSPEMVAAAGGEGGLSPTLATGITVVATLVTFAAVAVLSSLQVTRYLPDTRSPAFLADRAREILSRLGHEAPTRARAGRIWTGGEVLDFLSREGGDDPWRPLASGRLPAHYFYYRQSPRELVAPAGFTVVYPDHPPLYAPGEARVELDLQGRLLALAVVPPERIEAAALVPEPPWGELFVAADLDPATFEPASPEWTPSVTADTRAAWVGPLPGLPDVRVRIEAGAFQGRPTWFQVFGPWSREGVDRGPRPVGGIAIGDTIQVAMFVIGLAGAVFLARRNLRRGRGDRRGAFRIAFWFFVAHTLVWAIVADHARSPVAEWRIVERDLGYNLFLAVFLWLFYLGLEPYVRRQWPEILISWSRLLDGRFLDPRLGRDALAGVAYGGLFTLCMILPEGFPAWLSGEPARPRLALHFAGTAFLGRVVDLAVHSVLEAMLALFLLLLFLVVLRRRWPAVVAVGALYGVLFLVGRADVWPALVPVSIAVAASLFVLTRLGLLALASGLFVWRLIGSTPWSLDPDAWYAWHGWVTVAILLGLLVYGFRTAVAGRALMPIELAGARRSSGGG